MWHICASIGSDNGLSPIRRQAIIWTNAGLLSIGPLGTIFGEKNNQTTKLFIYENASENVVREKAAIFFFFFFFFYYFFFFLGGGIIKTAAHSIHELSSNVKRYFIENYINARSIPICDICKRVWKLSCLKCAIVHVLTFSLLSWMYWHVNI